MVASSDNIIMLTGTFPAIAAKRINRIRVKDMASSQAFYLPVLLSISLLAKVSAASPDQQAGPILQIQGGGPVGHITSLCFSPDGETLYAGGWDKAVWVWRRVGEEFHLEHSATFRVPIGPGLEGAINAIALSDDGQWLAVAGKGVFRGAAGFRGLGRMVPISAMELPMRLDQGTIHVIHTRTRQSFRLRGHEGEVVGMSFAPGSGPPILASAAREWSSQTATHIGTVRLWSLDARQQIDHLNDLPVPDGPPGIVLQRTGPQANQLSVSLAWWAKGEGSGVRFWDVSRGRRVVASQADYSRSLLSLPRNRRLSASFWRPQPNQLLKGVLRFWREENGGLIEEAQRRIDLVGGAGNFIPASLGVVRNNVVAITELGLVGNTLQADEARLRLVGLAGNQQANRLRTVKLWSASDPPRLPIMATSRTGDFVAVAGSPHGGVMLYRTAALLDSSKQPQAQQLRLPASRFERISFVSKDGGLGLRLLRDDASAGNWGSGVFDFNSRSLVLENLDAWQAASSDPARGSVTPGPRPTGQNSRQTIQLHDGANSLNVQLPSDNVLTAAALVDVDSRPVWAIASARAGQPLLQLYDGQTGNPMRELTGHEQRIRALTFSRDGHWLASIEDGPKLCVWSLADLNDARDNGALPGVVVVEGERPQTLKVLDAGDYAVLAAGDLILGYLDGGNVRGWPTARGFDDTWWASRPGDELTVRIQRDGQTRDLVLAARQGIDERKPLFSLLFTPNAARPTGSSWLAWSPLGVFDSSDRQVENLVGWHFNGTDEAPPVYSALHQHRAEYYRPYLVRELMRTLKIPPRPLPNAPDLSLWIPDSSVDTSGQANRIVRDREVTAVLNLDPNFPLDLIESVSLGLDGQPRGEFQLQADRTWLATLPSRLVEGDMHRVRSVVTTTESPPRHFQAELSFRFRPDAPIQSPRPALPLATVLPLRKGTESWANTQVDVDVELDRPPTDGETLKVIVNGQEVDAPLETLPAAGPNPIARATVTLDPAKEHRIEVRTANNAQSLVSEPLIVPTAAPTVKGVNREPLGDTAFESWAVEVESASRSSHVVLDKRELPPEDLQYQEVGNGVGRFVISGIAPTKKTFELRIDHGPPVEISSSPSSRTGAPQVQLLGSSSITISDTDRYTVDFIVRSPSHIDRVDVYNGTLVHRDANVVASTDSQGFYVVSKSVELDVKSGVNAIDILARNAHGEGSASLGITHLTYPSTVIVDGFSLERVGPVTVKPVSGSNGRLTFQQPLPTGNMMLHGRVRWSDPNDPQLRINRSTVHIWVNGFQQLPAPLAAADPGGQERGFAVPVVFNQDKANLIEIEVSSAEVVSNPRRFYVDCQQPVKNRRVHLLVVSVDQSDNQPETLVESAIEAFDGWRTDGARPDRGPYAAAFATPVFQSGFVYGPLTASNLNRRLLHATILEITRQIRVLSGRNPATDVILIYYRGAELINKPEGFYLTTAPADEHDPEFARIIKDPVNLEQFAVSSDLLNRIVETNPGAYVLLLDVARAANGAAEQAEWPNDSHAAMLRYAWLAGLRVPEAARLLVGLRAAVPKAFSLKEVYQKLESNYVSLREKHPRSVSFLGYLPPNLEELAMGGLTRPTSP